MDGEENISTATSLCTPCSDPQSRQDHSDVHVKEHASKFGGVEDHSVHERRTNHVDDMSEHRTLPFLGRTWDSTSQLPKLAYRVEHLQMTPSFGIRMKGNILVPNTTRKQ